MVCVVVVIGGRSLGAGLFVPTDIGLHTWMTKISVRAMCSSAYVAKPITLLAIAALDSSFAFNFSSQDILSATTVLWSKL